jgi:putative phosphoribosyl transferase
MKSNAAHKADHSRPIIINLGDVSLAGDLHMPANAKGLVVFAHGSGSSRHSPRNRFVAQLLHQQTMGTLLLDLLTAEEEKIDQVTCELRFDIPMLAKRFAGASDWLKKQNEFKDSKLGYFGASTGSAAALIAAARQEDRAAAVVSRGGRPDLAMNVLDRVNAPTLLIVGENDTQVLELNRQALKYLNPESRLAVIPRATHLFEEPGTLKQAAQAAAKWFDRYFSAESKTA